MVHKAWASVRNTHFITTAQKLHIDFIHVITVFSALVTNFVTLTIS